MSTVAPTDWIKHTNVYEVNVRQYTQEGTFEAFAQHLERLKDMGVETLWFMPVTPIAQKNKKGSLGSYYAASDYVSINPEFGTLDDFKSLVNKAHDLGFKVIIDWVANHTGWDHIWTIEHPEYYKRDSNTNDFKMAHEMEDIIELDYSNQEMRRAMIEAMKFWITETGIDGFRCDLAFWVQLDFWIEAKEELQRVKELFWLGELDPLEHPDYMQVFDAAYTWRWMHKTREWYQHHLPIQVLHQVLDDYTHVPGLQAWFTSNHDENSWNGSEYEKYGDAAKALAVFSCTWPGLPLIYNGQELPNYKRLQFFEKDPIEWAERLELHQFYKSLLTLHSSHPALSADKQEAPVERLYTSAGEQVLAYIRGKDDREVLVLLNLSPNYAQFVIHNNNVGGDFSNVFGYDKIELTDNYEFKLNAWEYLLLIK